MKIKTLITVTTLALIVSGCADIRVMKRGDRMFNQGDYSGAITEYEKIVELTTKSNSPYFELPTGEEAKKKIEVANVALLSKESFKKGNEELTSGNAIQAEEHYKKIDPQFLTDEEHTTYQKNLKELPALIKKNKEEADRKAKEEADRAAAEIAAKEKPPEILTVPVADPKHYLPIQAGYKFHYRFSIPIGQKIVYQSVDEEVLPQENLKGKDVIPVKKIHSTTLTDLIYYQLQGEQIVRVGEQKYNQNQVFFYDLPVIELQGPVAIGSSWVVQGKPRVIVGLEQVAVAGGNYFNCLKVAENSDLVKITRWYAPGIGLVKEEKITFPGKSYESQSIMELTGLEK